LQTGLEESSLFYGKEPIRVVKILIGLTLLVDPRSFLGSTTLSIKTLSIKILRITTLSIKALSIKTLSIMGLFATLSIIDT
jgi:hypothetical protein